MYRIANQRNQFELTMVLVGLLPAERSGFALFDKWVVLRERHPGGETPEKLA